VYNLRYHIASLVAVFLALALGLVLGGIVVERGTLDAQRTAIVNSLRKDFRALSAENKKLQQQLALQSEFAKAAEADVAKDRLKGQRVVIVSNGGRTDALQSTRSSLEQGGASVALVTVEKSGLGLSTDTVKQSLESKLETGTPTDVASVVTSLAAEWSTGAGDRPVTDALVAGGVITVVGLESGTAADGMTIIATSDGKPDAALLQLGRAFQSDQHPVVAAEALSQANGIAAAASELGLGAVNAIDTAAGSWSLVEMLSGGKPAFYGTGDDVDAAFPPLPPVQSATEPTTTP